MQSTTLTTARLEAFATNVGRTFLEKKGFTELFPPRIVRASGACENINTLFDVSSEKNKNWFGKPGKKHKSYLAQTAQLYLEAFVPYLDKVYAIGPSFRAEAGNDKRHLTEFTMIEIEFAGNFKELLGYIESFVFTIANRLAGLRSQEYQLLGLTSRDVKRLRRIKPIFPKITYDEAIKLLGLNWGDDIKSGDERRLVKMFDNHPVLITHYPDPQWDHGKEIEVEKFFNMIPDPKHPGRVQSADLILPISGEAVGSAARISDYRTLKKRLEHSRMFKRLEELGGSMADFSWYAKRIQEKSVPHAGCGFGMSRILRWLKNTDDIKKAVAFPSNQYNII